MNNTKWSWKLYNSFWARKALRRIWRTPMDRFVMNRTSKICCEEFLACGSEVLHIIASSLCSLFLRWHLCTQNEQGILSGVFRLSNSVISMSFSSFIFFNWKISTKQLIFRHENLLQKCCTRNCRYDSHGKDSDIMKFVCETWNIYQASKNETKSGAIF